jgi:hypothetical protein
MTLVTVTGTTQTPTIDQSKAYFLCTNAAGCAVTIPTNAAVAYPLLTLLTYEQNNTGALTFTGASGVTINAPSTHLKATVDRYSVVQLCKVGTDVWTLYGNLDPV